MKNSLQDINFIINTITLQLSSLQIKNSKISNGYNLKTNKYIHIISNQVSRKIHEINGHNKQHS